MQRFTPARRARATAAGALAVLAGAITGPIAAGQQSIEGYGAATRGALDAPGGYDVVRVTSLANSGPGTLREAIHGTKSNRLVVFDVGGEILLTEDIRIRGSYVTIDGSTAPPPGITLTRPNIHDGEIHIENLTDLVVRHIRIVGLWDHGGENSEGAANFQINDCTRVVIDHVTSRNATDGGPDIWGTCRDITIQWCFFFNNFHPTTISHYPAPYETRQRLTLHHNVYAQNDDRNPQVRADVRSFDYVNNVVYDWGYYSGGAGYGVRIRNEPGEPQVNMNVLHNWFVPGDGRASWALVYGRSPGPDNTDGGPSGTPEQGTTVTTTDLGDLYVRGNILPSANRDHYSTIPSPIPTPEWARVDAWDAADLPHMLRCAGMRYRTRDEADLLAEIYEAMTGTRPDSMAFAETCAPGGGGCPEDINGDGQVNVDDLSILLANFGAADAPGDVDGNGVVAVQDLSLLLILFDTPC